MTRLRYPIYIPSKNRSHACQTVKYFLKENVDFYLVVEPGQQEKYAEAFGSDCLLILPEDGMRLLGSRLWIREHSIANGFDRHWQFDDNIRGIGRMTKGRRIRCDPHTAISLIEDFTDRYENIGISGFNYQMFLPRDMPYPYNLNCHVYSASLINNRMPYKWRLFYNDDTDLCLQVLTNNLCTVLFNAFFVDKIQTMVISGGNTDDLYQKDGRLRMARTLEELWPEYVTTKIRFGRPQHVVKQSWKCFTTPLVRRKDIDWSNIPLVDNRGMKLTQIAEIKNQRLEEWFKQETKSTNEQ